MRRWTTIVLTLLYAVAGMSPSDVSFTLDDEYGIMTRPGCHCAPAAHRSIGTFPEGTVRMSLSQFTTEDDILYVLESVDKALR